MANSRSLGLPETDRYRGLGQFDSSSRAPSRQRWTQHLQPRLLLLKRTRKDRTLVSCEVKRNDAVVFRREADRTLRPTYEPGSKIGLRPSLFTPLRIGGLLSLHRQGGREEFARDTALFSIALFLMVSRSSSSYSLAGAKHGHCSGVSGGHGALQLGSSIFGARMGRLTFRGSR
jgi:hypothetical protein